MEKQQAIIVVDLGFGDSGKGTIVDYLTRREHAHTVIRFNGGAQAVHNVVTPDGRDHAFAQFGSGMFVSNVHTHLSQFMMVNPIAMEREEEHLRQLGITDAFARTTIDGDALITTPFHKAVNRIKELVRGNTRHGSSGVGIGDTMSDFITLGDGTLFARDLGDWRATFTKLRLLCRSKLTALKELLRNTPETDAIKHELRIFEPHIVNYCADRYEEFAEKVTITNGFVA